MHCNSPILSLPLTTFALAGGATTCANGLILRQNIVAAGGIGAFQSSSPSRFPDVTVVGLSLVCCTAAPQFDSRGDKPRAEGLRRNRSAISTRYA